QRLDTEPVAREHERARLAVPEPECKHPDGAFDCGLHSPESAGLEQHLGVRIAAHEAAGRLELAPDLAIIVDLAVEGDHVTSVRRRHRLRTAWTEIDAREPALPEGYTALGFHPDFSGVRSAVPQGLDHSSADRAQRVG